MSRELTDAEALAHYRAYQEAEAAMRRHVAREAS